MPSRKFKEHREQQIIHWFDRLPLLDFKKSCHYYFLEETLKARQCSFLPARKHHHSQHLQLSDRTSQCHIWKSSSFSPAPASPAPLWPLCHMALSSLVHQSPCTAFYYITTPLQIEGSLWSLIKNKCGQTLALSCASLQEFVPHRCHEPVYTQE